MYVPVYMCVFIFFSETIRPMRPKFIWNHKRIGRSFVCFFIIVSPREGGAFSRDFITILAPECWAFSEALKIEKLKAPLFRGPEGAGDTNDWCIAKHD